MTKTYKCISCGKDAEGTDENSPYGWYKSDIDNGYACSCACVTNSVICYYHGYVEALKSNPCPRKKQCDGLYLLGYRDGLTRIDKIGKLRQSVYTCHICGKTADGHEDNLPKGWASLDEETEPVACSVNCFELLLKHYHKGIVSFFSGQTLNTDDGPMFVRGYHFGLKLLKDKFGSEECVVGE